MSYRCLRDLETKLEKAVCAIVEAGTVRTGDGHWRVLLDDLGEKYGVSDPFSQDLMLKMLCECEQVSYAEQVGDEYFIDFDPAYCAFHQRQLFDIGRTKTTGVYTVELEGSDSQHVYTEYAGGYSMAHRVARLLTDARQGLASQVSDAELMPLLVSDCCFAVDGQRLFSPITETEAQSLLTAEDGQTAFHIVLDMARETVMVAPVPAAGECILPELTFMLHGKTASLDSLHLVSACAECTEEVFRQTIFNDLQKFVAQSQALERTAQAPGLQMG